MTDPNRRYERIDIELPCRLFIPGKAGLNFEAFTRSMNLGLGGIYVTRSIVLALYFMMPPTPASTLVFGAFMGFLWLGVGPLVAGAVAELFGLQWQAMIQGLAFMSHQLGSFLGAYGGGLIYDALGSYTLAWRIGVALGLAAGFIQVAFALLRPTRPPLTVAA